jgi:hypothetical protein
MKLHEEGALGLVGKGLPKLVHLLKIVNKPDGPTKHSLVAAKTCLDPKSPRCLEWHEIRH